MKQWFFGVLLLIAACGLQISGLNAILPAKIDWILLVVVCFGLLRGPREGLLFGWLAGALQGTLAGGLYFMIAKMAVGYLAGRLHPFLYRQQGLVACSLAAVATLLHETLITGMLALKLSVTPSHILPLVILNTLMAFPSFFLTRALMGGEA